MGNANGVAQHFSFTYAYQKEHLYEDLAQHFADDPKNAQIVQNIGRLKEVLTEKPELSQVARSESLNLYRPTCLQSAQLEYQRLKELYNEHMRLKSVFARVGFVACPLGHHCERIENEMRTCSICTHSYQFGYCCQFCRYEMCEPCSVIFCLEGHSMHLWTHAEAVHDCIVCKKQPICSGYRCHVCFTNICDACTDKPGRLFVQRRIREDIQRFLEYFSVHVGESSVAKDTLETHERDLLEHPFPTILDLMSKRVLYERLRQIVAAQVALYRVTKEVERIRALIGEDAHLSVPARRETERSGNFVQDEIDRLNEWLRVREKARSPSERAQVEVCCPLGHRARPYLGCPTTYLERNRIAEKRSLLSIKELRNEDDSDDDDDDSRWTDSNDQGTQPEEKDDEEDFDENREMECDSYIDCSENDTRTSSRNLTTTQRISLTNPPACRVCYRKSNSGNHCEFCEYDLCGTCSEVYCTSGHRMAIWNAEPVPCNLRTADQVIGDGLVYIGVEDGGESRHLLGMQDNSSVGSTVTSQGHDTRYSCSLCHRVGIESGYRCFECPLVSAFLCDLCTAPEGRKKSRKRWDDELDEIILFMKREKNFSEIARFYHWQSKAVIISVKLLVEHVRFMKEEQRRARLQIKYFDFIEDLKSMRKELIQYPRLCIISRIEASHEPDYVFESKQAVKKELCRLSNLLLVSSRLKSMELRSENKYACPLGHGSVPITEHDQAAMLCSQAANFRYQLYNGSSNSIDESFGSILNGSNDKIWASHASIGESSLAHNFYENGYADMDTIKCSVCSTLDLQGGRFCIYCQYFTCSTCSIIYCRKGHACKIWTFPEAHTLHCDVCRTQITSGYRCMECEVDICDMCTCKESRITMQLFPMKEALKILSYFDLIKEQSDIARSYVARYGSGSQPSKLNKEEGCTSDLLSISSSNTFRESKFILSNTMNDAPPKRNFAEEGGNIFPHSSFKGEDYSLRPNSSGRLLRSIQLRNDIFESEPKYIFESSLIWNRDVGPLQPGGSMAHTCRILMELKAAKKMVEEELGLKKLRQTQLSGAKSSSMARQQEIIRAWGSDL